jgi:hypothetical protein
MQKLTIATAAILAATLGSGSAFAVPGGVATKTLEAPAAIVNVNTGRHHREHRHQYHTQCCGYYSLHTDTTPCGCGAFFGGRFGW